MQLKLGDPCTQGWDYPMIVPFLEFLMPWIFRKSRALG